MYKKNNKRQKNQYKTKDAYVFTERLSREKREMLVLAVVK